MTREEAARILEYPVFKWSLDWDDREDGLEYSEAIQMAIAALRTQPAKLDRSRWDGCPFCRGKEDDGKDENFVARRRYCDVCGRPLTALAWAELERRIGGS